jgi:ABC-type multidrug transport system ATPase subunit
MKNKTSSEFTIGFSNLIVWVDNKSCFKRRKKPKTEKKDLNSSYETYKTSMKLKSSKIEDSMDPELLKKENEIMQENKEELVKEIKGVLVDNEQKEEEDDDEIPILKKLNGIIKSGSMTSIIGPSGSGKTTLMNFISSRSSWDANMYVDGQLLLNGQNVKNLSKYKHLIGFVPQQDILYEESTVRENLHIYGRIRSIPNYQEKAQEIIDNLGLTKCADTIVGNSMVRGISGGERKRACIAVELMGDPKILFLDEPTTGIDAYTALEVMTCLKKLNEDLKMSIVAVLHQPRQEILDLFNQVASFLNNL